MSAFTNMNKVTVLSASNACPTMTVSSVVIRDIIPKKVCQSTPTVRDASAMHSLVHVAVFKRYVKHNAPQMMFTAHRLHRPIVFDISPAGDNHTASSCTATGRW